MQQPRALGAEAGQARDRDQTRGKLGSQLLGGGDRHRLEQRQDLLLQRRADPGQLARAALACERGDRDRGLAHALGRRAVGQHAVDDRTVELVQIAELFQCVGDRTFDSSVGIAPA